MKELLLQFQIFLKLMGKILDSCYHKKIKIFKKVLKVSKLSFHEFLSVAAKRL